jgi:hypothetical protein
MSKSKSSSTTLINSTMMVVGIKEVGMPIVKMTNSTRTTTNTTTHTNTTTTTTITPMAITQEEQEQEQEQGTTS